MNNTLATKLQQQEELFQTTLKNVKSMEELARVKSQFLGKGGALSEISSGLREVSPDERKNFGVLLNQTKKRAEDALQNKLLEIEDDILKKEISSHWIDYTDLPGARVGALPAGGIHPITRVRMDLEDFFLSMGFEVIGGPHIEDEFHNFDALNMPGDHPSRDLQDTFWFPDRKHLLRTQTSCVQIRGMKERTPPFRFVAPGKVFRCERTDATHESVFHQLEGMLVSEDTSLSHLLYFAKSLFTHIFQREVELRVRPSYFPFVEPGIEIDCSYEKGWLEMMGAGMVHPYVLKAGGIDPEKYRGFAFGLGIDRLTLLRYGIDDIRHLHSGDLRFSSQFSSF